MSGYRRIKASPLPTLEELEGETLDTVRPEELTRRLNDRSLTVASIGDQYGGIDSWIEGHDTRYRPDGIYTRATNKHDHSQQIHTPWPRDVVMQVDVVVDRVHELRSRHDFIRDAVIHRLWWWAQRWNDTELANNVSLQMLRAVQEAMSAEVNARRELIDNAEKVLREMQEARDDVALTEAIEFHRAIAAQLPDPYRSQLARVVERFEKNV